MKRSLRNLLVTGGAGFIGSSFIRYLFEKTSFAGTVVNLDKLTYAGRRENCADIEREHQGSRYFFERADLCDFNRLRGILSGYNIDTIVHFAAETHVDRSIHGPRQFVQSNIVGTFNLLEAAREYWRSREGAHFHHVSTDEVFGSLPDEGFFDESSRYDPRSPYSASKAASDFLVRALSHTYGLPVTISNCSNNYGPFQYPEKLIPLAILNLLAGESVPVYGNGRNVRDWLFVDDHSEAIWRILRSGADGRTWLVGGGEPCDNLSLVKLLCRRVALLTGGDPREVEGLITFVEDRPGHDLRYAVDCRRIRDELEWQPRTGLVEGLDATIRWYRENASWVARARGGNYRKWMAENYGARALTRESQ